MWIRWNLLDLAALDLLHVLLFSTLLDSKLSLHFHNQYSQEILLKRRLDAISR